MLPITDFLSCTDPLDEFDSLSYHQTQHAKTYVTGLAANADDLLTVAADNGFQDWKTEYEIAGLDVEYLVHYRGSSPKAVMNNALIRTKGYTQRWMAETSYSTTKRSLGDAV